MCLKSCIKVHSPHPESFSLRSRTSLLSLGEGLEIRKYLCRAAIFLSVLITTTTFAQTLSLFNVLDSIEHNNPLIASYNYKIKAAHTLANGAKAWAPPMIGIGPYSVPYAVSNDETFFNRNQGMIMYFAQQDIPNPSKLKAKGNYLSSLASVDSAGMGYAKNQLFTEAKTAYIERFIAEKQLKIIIEEITLLNLMIKTDTATYAVNQSDLTSIYKTQARLHSMEAMRVHQVSAIQEATAKLNYLMNRAQGSLFRIDTVIPFKNYTLADLDTSATYISLHRSDVLKMNNSIASMQLNYRLTLSAAKPDFNIRYEHYDMFGESRNSFSLMGMITIPIAPWSSKGYKTESAAMLLQIDAMSFENQNNINQARSMMQQSLLHTIAEYAEVNHYEKEILPAYKKAFQSGLIAYRENTGRILSTLLALDDLIMAETEYLYHLEQAYKSELNFENAIEMR
ncbi:MAG: TolC family protein [Chitinophagales bacterium]